MKRIGEKNGRGGLVTAAGGLSRTGPQPGGVILCSAKGFPRAHCCFSLHLGLPLLNEDSTITAMVAWLVGKVAF